MLVEDTDTDFILKIFVPNLMNRLPLENLVFREIVNEKLQCGFLLKEFQHIFYIAEVK